MRSLEAFREILCLLVGRLSVGNSTGQDVVNLIGGISQKTVKSTLGEKCID